MEGHHLHALPVPISNLTTTSQAILFFSEIPSFSLTRIFMLPSPFLPFLRDSLVTPKSIEPCMEWHAVSSLNTALLQIPKVDGGNAHTVPLLPTSISDMQSSAWASMTVHCLPLRNTFSSCCTSFLNGFMGYAAISFSSAGFSALSVSDSASMNATASQTRLSTERQTARWS